MRLTPMKFTASVGGEASQATCSWKPCSDIVVKNVLETLKAGLVCKCPAFMRPSSRAAVRTQYLIELMPEAIPRRFKFHLMDLGMS
jgi:hypothetical protein